MSGTTSTIEWNFRERRTEGFLLDDGWHLRSRDLHEWYLYWKGLGEDVLKEQWTQNK